MDEFEKNYNRALRFLSFRVRSEKEIREYFKLRIKNHELRIKEEMVDKIIEKLKKYKFLNDEEFARIWIEQRLKLKPRAWRIIEFELKRKGISDEIIKSQLTIDDLQLTNEKMARDLVQRKLKRYENLSKQEQREKLGRFLAGKGFNWDTIKKAIDEINK